jgi:hypothetical protein
MNKKLIIIGILGLAGAGAFLYFKSKNKLGKNDTPSSAGGLVPSSAGGLVPTSGTSVLPTTTTTTTTPTPTSTLSVPPTQSSVTIGDVVLTTPVQVVETAIKIAEAKSIATQILNLRNTKNRWTTISLDDYARETGKQFFIGKSGGNAMLQLLKSNSLTDIDAQIKELDKTLALLGYTEMNGSIQKI